MYNWQTFTKKCYFRITELFDEQISWHCSPSIVRMKRQNQSSENPFILVTGLDRVKTGDNSSYHQQEFPHLLPPSWGKKAKYRGQKIYEEENVHFVKRRNKNVFLHWVPGDNCDWTRTCLRSLVWSTTTKFCINFIEKMIYFSWKWYNNVCFVLLILIKCTLQLTGNCS